jgi:hypothetical protein
LGCQAKTTKKVTLKFVFFIKNVYIIRARDHLPKGGYMSPLIGSMVSFLLLALGMIMVIIMLNLQGNPKERPSGALIKKTHRFMGYLFILLYLVMLVAMIIKVSGAAIEFSARIAIHLSLALLLFPLILIKVLIVRYYKRLYGHLVNLGLLIFFLSFVMVLISAGYFLLQGTPSAGKNSGPADTAAAISKQEKLDLLFTRGKKILDEKCSSCHNHDRINSAKKNQQDWQNTLERMVNYSRNPDYLSKAEFSTLIDYLSTREPTRARKAAEKQR